MTIQERVDKEFRTLLVLPDRDNRVTLIDTINDRKVDYFKVGVKSEIILNKTSGKHENVESQIKWIIVFKDHLELKVDKCIYDFLKEAYVTEYFKSY